MFKLFFTSVWPNFFRAPRTIPKLTRQSLLLVALMTALLLPTPAKASCTGFLDCLLGFTERTEVRSAAQTEQARIQAAAQIDITRIQSEQAERVRQADAVVEQIRQQQYESEAQRDIAIAQAQQQAEQYKSMIAGLTSEKVSGIQANADTQIAALQAQAQIAVAGITQTGQTEQYRIVAGWAFAIIAIVLIAGLLVTASRRQSGGQTIVLLADPDQIRHLQTPVHKIEVNYAKHHITHR